VCGLTESGSSSRCNGMTLIWANTSLLGPLLVDQLVRARIVFVVCVSVCVCFWRGGALWCVLKFVCAFLCCLPCHVVLGHELSLFIAKDLNAHPHVSRVVSVSNLPALVRNERLAGGAGRSEERARMRIFTSAGQRLSSIAWDYRGLVGMGWTNDQKLCTVLEYVPSAMLCLLCFCICVYVCIFIFFLRTHHQSFLWFAVNIII
jgi:hypothetical protein